MESHKLRLQIPCPKRVLAFEEHSNQSADEKTELALATCCHATVPLKLFPSAVRLPCPSLFINSAEKFEL